MTRGEAPGTRSNPSSSKPNFSMYWIIWWKHKKKKEVTVTSFLQTDISCSTLNYTYTAVDHYLLSKKRQFTFSVLQQQGVKRYKTIFWEKLFFWRWFETPEIIKNDAVSTQKFRL